MSQPLSNSPSNSIGRYYDNRFDLDQPISDIFDENYDKENIPLENEKTQKRTYTANKINSLNNSGAFPLTDRSNQPAKKAKKPHYPRDIRPTADAASVKQNSPDKINGVTDDFSLVQHAYMRIQTFALTVVGLYGIAKRSDGTFRVMDIEVDPAPLQVGRGSRSGPHKYHGSHDNATSGLHLKGFREALIQEIINEGGEITPRKKRLLKAKKFTEEQFAELLKNSDEKSVRAIFDLVWPIDTKKPHTVFTGTQTDINLNTTTEASILVNLGIDKHIERHRDEICELYLKITCEAITQEEACAEYCTLIKGSLAKLELDLQASIALIDEYQTALLTLKDHEEMSTVQIKSILSDLHTKALKIHPPKSKKTANNSTVTENPAVDSESSKKDTDFHPKITKNKEFLKSSLYTSQNDSSAPLSTFKTWMTKRWESLKKEIADQQKNLTAYLKYCRLELDGTKSPDFTLLFGEFNPETGKRELNGQILSLWQEKSWNPLSPTSQKLQAKTSNKTNAPSRSQPKRINKEEEQAKRSRNEADDFSAVKKSKFGF